LNIITNTIWNVAGSPYIVSNNIDIVSGASLTIQPGVQVVFEGNYALQVDGTLQVLGSSNQPVVFTSGKSVPQRGDWTGLVFTGLSTNNPCVLSNAVVQYAQVGVKCTATSPELVNSTIQYCSQQGIYLTQSSPLIQGCTIQQNSSYGIYCSDTSSPQILGNQILANSSYGIYLYGTYVSGHNCLPVIQGNVITGNGSYALYSYYYYQPGQTVIDCRSNWWGTADASVIAGLVYDYNDNSSYSPVVNYGNWLESQGGSATPGSATSGPILSNTVWQVSNSPIQIIGNVQVVSNAMLTIQPGVQVVFYGNYQLQVNGGLQPLGGTTNHIVFTSGKNVPNISDWSGLLFNPGSTNSSCLLSNVLIEYANTAVYCYQSSPTITSSQLTPHGSHRVRRLW
jgi:parallel beta-helix repeat protein